VLEGVSRAFGALRAIEDISFSVAVGERRAVLGANGAGKTTLFKAITGDFPPTADGSASSARTSPACRRMSASGAGFAAPTNRPCCSATSRFATIFSWRPGASAAAASASSGRAPGIPRATRPRTCSNALASRIWRSGWSRSCRTGELRQLEIGMALAGAPRLILFDEPAAGLSPGERRELVALLSAFPPHMGFVLIEHDLDIALRVVERVTILHNGRVLKHGTPEKIETDRRRAGDLHGGRRPWLITRLPDRSIARGAHLDVLLRARPRCCRASRCRLDGGVLAVVGRNGMGKTTLCNAITGLVPAAGACSSPARTLIG
jgi:branched-chain amino acid transport system ATP-binding protein